MLQSDMNQVHTRNLAGRAAIWGSKLIPAAFFANAGVSKLLGAARQVALFDAIGLGQWFRYVTGAIEIACVVLLLVPATCGLGALGLSALSAGALLTLIMIGRSALPGIVALAWCLALVFAQRGQIAGYVTSLTGTRSDPTSGR